MRTELQKEAGAGILKEYGNFFKKSHQEYVLLCNYEPWEENKSFLPIQVEMSPTEVLSVAELVSSDNVIVTKVLGVLSSLCIEIVTLKSEAFNRYFKFLAIYEEYSTSDIEGQLEEICLLNAFLNRCDETLYNICNQLFSLYTENLMNLNGIQLHYIINHIGELFTLIVLTELLISHTTLSAKWSKYCKNVKNLSATSDLIEFSEEKIKALIGALDNITTKLMNDDIVQNTLFRLSKLRISLVDKNCSLLSSEFTQYLKQAVSNLDRLVLEKPNVNNMYKCIKINALFVLNASLFGNNDKKLFKSLVELDVKAHSIYVIGTTIWFPEQFLQRYLPALFGSNGKISHTILKARQNYMSTKKASIAKELTQLQVACSQWLILAENMFSADHHKLSAAEMSSQTNALLECLDISSNINCSVLTLINLHLALGAPLSKSMLMIIFEITEILKSIRNVITRNHNQVINSLNMIINHLIFQATASLIEVKKKLMTDKNYANKRLDELTCIVIAERTLRGAATKERNIAASIALSFIPATTYVEDSYDRLGILLEKLLTLSNFTKAIGQFCNCSWILWHQHIIPMFFEKDFIKDMNSLKLKYFLNVLDDCVRLLVETDKVFKSNKHQEFIDTTKVLIEEKVLKSASQSIETNLRLHIHSHLQLDAVSPFSTTMPKRLVLIMDTIKLQSLYLAVIPSVEHYLSTMIYNLTTVVLSDWKTYGEMRQMANFKFKITTVQDNLPTQTLEQGLDVLEIMRNIHIFVSKYLYNLNNQIFIEKSSNNKHLNSINIRHIANSIRTHGTGIMNTTVNFTYQFLKKKFFTFSQFMYDEQIKSRLTKDLRNFKEAPDKMYPYRNADKFNKGIKALGLADEGQSYLDLFRDLVSQIGNAMGYVRMIRSGGRHCCSDATIFLTTLNLDTASFRELCQENSYGEKTIESAENLDNNIRGLINNFIQGTEYFKLLVEVFAPVFRNPKNVHLKNFYLIVPPLTLNFVEHMILSKDKMSKKNKVGAAFTDDGFAMGIAYILKLLDQDSDFEALHWFDSVWKHIQNESNQVEEQKSKGSAHLQQALALTEKKLRTLDEEFKLLHYSLSSARIFFR